jgi:ligand-binding sensor domain-containing protein
MVMPDGHKIKQPTLKLSAWFASLLFIIAFPSWPAFSQHITKDAKFRRLTENIQLSNLNITTITQDSKGFLWVGTLDGLNRFDGYDFKIYRNVENDTTSLVKNRIETIFEDSNGTLWVSTLNSGLQYYNRKADAFCRIPEFSQRYCQVFRIMEDKQHNLWIGGAFNEQAFVAVRDYKTRKWKKFLLFRAAEGIYSILQISENEFWLGSQSNGLLKWNRKTNIIEQHFLHDPNNTNSLPGNDIRKIDRDNNGNLWIATHDGGLCKVNLQNNQYTRFTTESTHVGASLPNNTIRCMISDGRYLWIATENGGLSRMDVNTQKLTNFLYDKVNPNSIINNSIWTVFKDRQGRIWAGSFAKGLCVLDVLEDKIPIYDHSLESDLVNVIFMDSKNRMWIGTEDGLVLKDNTGSHRFRFDSKNKSSISSNAINCVFEDRKHRIWIGVWNGGINRFVENSKTFVRYTHESNRKESLTDPNVFNI